MKGETNFPSLAGGDNAIVWRLADPASFTEPALHGHHVHWLCVLAFVVAVLASWVLLSVLQRYQYSSGRSKQLWLMAGSVVMGTGIWAMHFTGMLAFSLPVPVAYDPLITFASALPAMLASACFLLLYEDEGMRQSRMLTLALIMAVGIGVMHYLGMEAVEVAADMYYEPVMFTVSILAAMVLAYAAVLTQNRLRQMVLNPVQSKVIGSLSLGLAVTLMHFIAMSATFFQPNEHTMLSQISEAPLILVFEVITITCLLFFIASLVSIVDRRMIDMSSRLEKSENRFQRLAESTQTAIFTFNQDHITYANPALSQILGRSLTDLYAMRLEDVFDLEVKAQAKVLLNGTSPRDHDYQREILVTRPDGEERWLLCSLTHEDMADEAFVLASAFDISEQKRAESKMRELAYYDHLTGLHNRTVFMDRLQHTLAKMQRYDLDGTACVMILDLDGFKLINDSLGHLQGDQLLIAVANRLQSLARGSDTISRFGGDEFVLLLENIEHSINIDHIVQRFLKVLSQPTSLDGHEVEVSCSIGVVELNSAYKTPDQVLHDADLALYRAKDTGAGWTVFDENLDAEAKRKRLLLPELKMAIERGDLELHYQPICGAKDSGVQGLEALARWQRQSGEWVSPGEFIPLAEESGLVHAVGLWALQSAGAKIAELNKAGYGDVYVSINIDADTLNDSRFIPLVKKVFANHGIGRGQLKIELTERGLVKDTQSVIEKMEQLIELGCEFMIDDFGTGYSSLSYLHQLPFSTLKIDRSFVINMEVSESSATVVNTIIVMAKSLGLKIVAEGVETESQVNALKALNSDQLQGYYFARPMPFADVQRYIAEAGDASSRTAAVGS